MTENRRRFSRIHFVTDASLQVGESHYDAHVLDLSLKGVLLQVSQVSNPLLGSEGIMQFRLEGSDIVLRFLGILAHCEGDRLGYRFAEMDLDSMSHLRQLLEYNLGDPAQLKREVQALCDEPTQKAD
jgi:hypothetical protein